MSKSTLRTLSLPDGIAVSVMQPQHLAMALELSRQAGWNQTFEDWNLFVQNSPSGCFVATKNSSLIGTVATISYGEVAWISMMLVDAAFQRKGIGKQLMQCALEHLAKIPTIKLDATPAGQPLYEKLGFVVVDEFSRWICERLPEPTGAAKNDALSRVNSEDLPAIAEFDCRVFGAPRAQVLDVFRRVAPSSAIQSGDTASLQGFSLGRAGTRFHQIGPVAAAHLETALAITESALEPLAGCVVGIDVPTRQTGYSAWLQARGFVQQRSFSRMVKGVDKQPFSSQQFAIAGPEFG